MLMLSYVWSIFSVLYTATRHLSCLWTWPLYILWWARPLYVLLRSPYSWSTWMDLLRYQGLFPNPPVIYPFSSYPSCLADTHDFYLTYPHDLHYYILIKHGIQQFQVPMPFISTVQFLFSFVILCFLEGSYIRARSATVTHGPYPFNPVILCWRDKKKCFGESSLFHFLRLRLHVPSDVDLKHLSQPFHLSPVCLLLASWWVCRHSFCTSVEMWNSQWWSGAWRNGAIPGWCCGVSPAHRDSRSLRTHLLRHLHIRAGHALWRESCSVVSQWVIQHGGLTWVNFPRQDQDTGSQHVGLETRLWGRFILSSSWEVDV